MKKDLSQIINDENYLIKNLNTHFTKGNKITNQIVRNKIMTAFKEAAKNMETEYDAQECLLKAFSRMQELQRKGIDINQPELWLAIPYKKEINIQFEYKAYLDAAKKRGYVCIPTFYYLEKGEDLKLMRNPEGKIISQDMTVFSDSKDVNLENIYSGEFSKFVCVIDIYFANQQMKFFRSDMNELSNEEMKARKGLSKQVDVDLSEKIPVPIWLKSSNGKSYPKKDEQGNVVPRTGSDGKPMYKTATPTIWQQHTKKMVNKTLIRDAFLYLQQVLPELEGAFEFAEIDDNQVSSEKTENIDINGLKEVEKIDLKNPSEEHKKQADDMVEIWKTTIAVKKETKKDFIKSIASSDDADTIKGIINKFGIFILATIKSDEINKTKEWDDLKEILNKRKEELKGE